MTSSCYYRQLQAIVENVFVFSAISALDVLRRRVIQIYILLNLLTYLFTFGTPLHFHFYCRQLQKRLLKTFLFSAYQCN